MNEEMTHVVLACDESGAKGYADRNEQETGEVGVFAGILINLDRFKAVAGEFDAVAAKYVSFNKLHITDLAPAQQQSLRQEMFSLLLHHRLPCFWEAIHVAGFHKVHRTDQSLHDRAMAGHRSRVKLSVRPPAPASLHVALFQGLYSRVIAFCMEPQRAHLHLQIRTDQVDSPIAKTFEQRPRNY